MHGITKHYPPFSLITINPDDWNNIAIPLTDSIVMMLKETYRLGLRTEDTSRSINSIKQKHQDTTKHQSTVIADVKTTLLRNLETLDKNLKETFQEELEKLKKEMESKLNALQRKVGQD